MLEIDFDFVELLDSLSWFFVYPGPKGSEENQFTPLGDGVNKLIFE
jgi:hypothetical protein